MTYLKTKTVTVINDETTNKTQVKYLDTDILYERGELGIKEGIQNTLDGVGIEKSVILSLIALELEQGLKGAEEIASLKPDTLLVYDNLDLDELSVYPDTVGVENPVIKITQKDIDRAEYTVENYKFLLNFINNKLDEIKETETPRVDLQP